MFQFCIDRPQSTLVMLELLGGDLFVCDSVLYEPDAILDS